MIDSALPAVSMLLLALGTVGSGSAEQSGTHITMTDDLSAIARAFTAAEDKVRLVFIVGPTCGVCLRGLDDMNRVLGDEIRTNPKLEAFVVHVPTLGAKEINVAPATPLLQGRDIHHYWDERGKSGTLYQEVLKLRHKSKPDSSVYAWDVWMIYRPGAKWTGEQPPKPDYWEHQLDSVDEANHLNPERFAAKVREYLAYPR